MLTAYLVLMVLAAVLMSLGCIIPAVILGSTAMGLALRQELRWVHAKARTVRPVVRKHPVAHV